MIVVRGQCTRTDEITVEFFPLPEPVSISGTPAICPGAVGISYEVEEQAGYTYHWEVEGGTLASGQGTAQITVDWPNENLNAAVKLVQENEFGCTNDTLVFPVQVFFELQSETPSGLTQVCVNKADGNQYSVRKTNGSAYRWEISGGTITAGQGSETVTVDWDGIGQHYIWLNEEINTLITSCVFPSDSLEVNVYQDSAAVELQNVSLIPEQPNQVAISWTAENPDRFQDGALLLQEKAVSETDFSAIQSSAVTNLGDTITNAAVTNAPHDFRIQALNRCDETLTTAPFRTIFLQGDKAEETQTINLNWTAFSGWDVAGYELWSRVDGNGGIAFRQTVAANQLSGSLTNGLDGFTHEVWVKAIAADGRESWSNRITVRFEHVIDVVPNVFTPNDDGFNETFIIPKTPLYPDNEFVVVNRWGKVVYRKQGYQNDWDAKGLPTGVYYFQFRAEAVGSDVTNIMAPELKEAQVIKGTIHIIRYPVDYTASRLSRRS